MANDVNVLLPSFVCVMANALLVMANALAITLAITGKLVFFGHHICRCGSFVGVLLRTPKISLGFIADNGLTSRRSIIFDKRGILIFRFHGNI